MDRLNEVHESESWIDGGCGANAHTWLIKINILEQISCARVTVFDCPHAVGCLRAFSITKSWYHSLLSDIIFFVQCVINVDPFADYFSSNVAPISLSNFIMAPFLTTIYGQKWKRKCWGRLEGRIRLLALPRGNRDSLKCFMYI